MTAAAIQFSNSVVTRYGFAISRREAPEFGWEFPALENKRAQGRPGARCTRGLACKFKQKNAHEHTGSAETLRPSLRNGFTAYFALSPVTGLSCHRRLADRSARLDTSVGVSGPHDFAVRVSIVRLRLRARRCRVHRIPCPTFATIMIRPSYGLGIARISKDDLPDRESGIFFREGLDRANQLDPVGEISFYAQSDFLARAEETVEITPEMIEAGDGSELWREADFTSAKIQAERITGAVSKAAAPKNF